MPRNEDLSLPPISGLEPTPRSSKTEQYAWIVSARLVRRRPPTALSSPRDSSTPDGSPRTRSDEIVFVVPDMEFAASALRKVAKRHTLCAHSWDLSCSLFGRWREWASRYTTRERTLDRMGVPRTKGGEVVATVTTPLV